MHREADGNARRRKKIKRLIDTQEGADKKADTDGGRS